MADTGSFVLPPLIPVAFCLWPLLLPKPAQSRHTLQSADGARLR